MRTKLLVALGVLVSTAALAGGLMWRRTVAWKTSAQHVQGQTIVSPTKGSLIGQKLPSTPAPWQFHGGVEVSLGGEAEMLLTDPSGRRTGVDAVSKDVYAELPDATAGGDDIDDATDDNSDSPIHIRTKSLHISGAVAGTYVLSVSSATEGTYDLQLAALSPSFQGSNASLSNVQIEAGARHVYLFRGDTANGGSLQLLGGYPGEGDTAKNGNRMLSYANPTGSKTHLPHGTRVFSLVVFYDSRASSDRFSAVLDENQITNMFHPTPGKFEKVDIPLHPGRNLLVLTIADPLAGSVGRDQDRMEFVVPYASPR